MLIQFNFFFLSLSFLLTLLYLQTQKIDELSMTKNPSSHSPLKHHSHPSGSNGGSPSSSLSTVHHHHPNDHYVHAMNATQKHSHSHNPMISQQPTSPLSYQMPANRSSAHVSIANNSTFHCNSTRTLPRSEHKLATVNVINTSLPNDGHNCNSNTLGHHQRHATIHEMRV